MHLTQWLVGTSTTVALAIGGWALSGTASNSERIAVVETEIRRLERIEDKLDWLVGERVKDYRRPESRPEPRPEARSDTRPAETERDFPEAPPRRGPRGQAP